jgi:hypothetical protein
MSGVVAPVYAIFDDFVARPGETAIAASAKTATLAPATWVAQNFQFSRFDMRIRFKFICTKFHRGRVRFVYDPNQVINNFSEGKVFTKIIDLNVDNDVTIDIPYMAYAPRIEHPRILKNSYINIQEGYDSFFNLRNALVQGPFRNAYNRTIGGIWRLEAMTDLSCPTDAFCYIECHTSFHNVDFIGPTAPFTNEENAAIKAPGWSYSAPTRIMRESDEYDTAPGAKSYDKVGASTSDLKHLNLLSGGECIKSVRQLLHRWNYADVMVSSSILKTVQSGRIEVIKRRCPIHHGTNAITTDLFNNTDPYLYHMGGSTSLNYFMPAYAVWRGGINWRMNADFRDVETLALNNQWQGHLVKLRVCSLGRNIQESKVNSNYSESITVTADPNPINAANLRSFKESMYDLYSKPLICGAEVSTELSDGVLQQIEATFPDYQPNRAHTCNIYRLAASGAGDQFNGSGGLAQDPICRDTIVLTGQFKREGNNIETTSQNPENALLVVQSYCNAAPDFSLMGFMNVPTMYYYTNLQDPV